MIVSSELEETIGVTSTTLPAQEEYDAILLVAGDMPISNKMPIMFHKS
jgi:hypothetical protein